MPIIDAFVKQRQSWTALSLTRVDWRIDPSQHCPPIAKLSADWTSVQDHNQAKSLGSCSWQPFCRPWPPILHGSATTAQKAAFSTSKMFGGHARGPWQSGELTRRAAVLVIP